MSIQNDREYFNKHIKGAYGHTVEWNNGLPVAALDLMMWNIWQASANRQGYKFVPVDINENIESAMFSSVAKGDMPRDIYKAMIGAIE